MIRLPVPLAAALLGAPLLAQGEHHEPRLSNEPAPMRTDLVPERLPPPIELGDPFLGRGPLGAPFETITGAVLRPAFTVFGSLRTAVSSFDDGSDVTSEAAARLDLFGNLQLSGTERILIGFRPLDEDGRFTRYTFEGPGEHGFEDELNAEVTTFFFEGDLGEILPGLDPHDRGRTDLGLAVGRQQITIQDGLLVDDRIDAVGVTRNTILPRGGSNLRLTGLFGWNELNRGDNVEDDDALLFGLLSEADFPLSTVSLDLLWVESDDDAAGSDALYLGGGAVQRVGHWNTTVRVETSQPSGAESAAAGKGTLCFGQLSRTLTASHDQVYANAFWGIDEFTSAARGPETGGPLGGVGILFAAVGVGTYGSPLENDATRSVGGALGWQTFLGDDARRRQLVLELGGRADTDSSNRESLALGARLQQAVGRRTVVRLDAFVAGRDDLAPRAGARLEVQVKL